MAGASALSAPAKTSGGQLGSRVIVGAFLAAVAIADIWIGGWAFVAMIALGTSIVAWEWGAMHGDSRIFRAGTVFIICGASVVAMIRDPLHALAALGAGLFIGAVWRLGQVPQVRRGWAQSVAGGLYAGLPAVALITLRNQPDGLALVMWTMALVWMTDIGAYFAGRGIGGPKLWPAISPNKTWAGLFGGAAAAGVFSALFGHFAGWAQAPVLLFALGAFLACVAQAGDFFESWLKRRAGVKDSGTLLRSHGGIMDRVDGLVPVACVVGLWVAMR